MARQGVVIVEDQVAFGVEGQHRQALGRYSMGRVDRGQRGFGLVVVIAVGDKAREAEDGGAVGGVTHTGKGQRAVQRTLDPMKLEGRGAHHVEEACGGHHRPHGVRRGRADAHFEHVEDGEEHIR